MISEDTFFGRLDEQERAELLALGGRRSFAAGTILILQGEVDDDRLILLLDGRAKVTRTAEDDHELMLAIRDAGELLGELAFIDGQPRIASVTALEPVEALVFSASRFRSFLHSAPRVAVVLLESVTSRFRDSTVKRLEFAASDTLGRLAARIIELADRYGEPTDAGIAVAMPISQDELASWTGASRAGVAQGLQTMRELGWLSTERRRLIVHDPSAVRDRAA
ncbi:MAG TPA: Crp/Fnr family transcriptional regulator [Solirubrobacteraceae bacterium]|nr:Crp/Fnr family transcriptional regulator [Solirubrobacteraceae bacterium]